MRNRNSIYFGNYYVPSVARKRAILLLADGWLYREELLGLTLYPRILYNVINAINQSEDVNDKYNLAVSRLYAQHDEKHLTAI